jgi:hypothetical protein
MAAPKGASYTPKSGPLAGRIFVGTPGTSQAYNRYQQARSHVLGFPSYRVERQARKSNEFRAIIAQETHTSGKRVSVQRRTDLLRAFAQHQRIETVQQGTKVTQRFGLDVDINDHTRGGSYDMYLRSIGRRVGNEEWLPGETP